MNSQSKRRTRQVQPPIRCANVVAALILSVLMASCTTGPDYARPDLRIPDHYKSATQGKAAEINFAKEWWRLFGDVELDALVAEALAGNQDVKAAMARVAQARAASSSVKSGFYPVVTMNPSATRTRRPDTTSSDANETADKLSEAASVINKLSDVIGRPPTDGGASGSGTTQLLTALGSASGSTSTASVSTISNAYQIPFDFSYEIDLWGRLRRAYESAEAELKASEYELEVVRQTLIADLAQNYFNMRSFDAQDAIIARNVRLYEEQVELTRDKYAAGLSTESDHLQAVVQLESARADLEDIRRQRDNVEHALAILMGRPPADFDVVSRPLEGAPPEVPAGMPGELLRRRPDVAEAETKLMAASADIGVAQAEFFPTINLTGSAGFESANSGALLDWSNRIWSIGPSISLPLTDGGKLRSNLREAQARYDELEATYRGTVLLAFGDVEDALTDLHRRADQAEAQGRALDAAREYQRLTSIEYDTGIIDYLQLVDAEQALLNNELAAAKILNERMVSTVLLIKAIGSGWDSQQPVESVAR